LSLADIHLAPMIGYFTMVSEANTLFNQHKRLAAWWLTISERLAYLATTPRLPNSSS
jgi:glutathione S-transferase